MTPRAWASALLFAGILWAALIVAWWLVMAAGTSGVEAWHDSAVPAGAFVAIRSARPAAQRPLVVGAPRMGGSDGPTLATAPALHQPRTPSPSLRAVPRLAATAAPSGPRVSALAEGSRDLRAAASMTGISSWYQYVPGQAAAGPALRVGDWRGRTVTVRANGVEISVRLTDFCQCYGTRLIDLDVRDFARLAPLSQGLQEVTISW